LRIQAINNSMKKRDSMTISERVQDVLNKFNVNLTVSEAPRTDLAEATLENGTVIYTDADDFTEGAEAYIINDEGERIPLPPGDYTLQDGGVIVVADGGKVASVNKGGKDGQPAKGKPEAAPVAEKAPDTQPSVKDAPTKDPAPTDPPPKVRKSSDEEEEVMYVTKKEVEEMIAAALEAMQPKEEEMSEEVAEEVAELEEVVEEKMSSDKQEVEAILAELSSVKEKLAEMQKQAADGGLKHAAPTKKVEPVNLTNLSTSERVSALLNQFSK
jgi:hypothetical protein